MSTDWHIYPGGDAPLPTEALDERWLVADHCPPWRQPRQAWSDRPDRVDDPPRSFDADDEGARRDRDRAVHYVTTGWDERDGQQIPTELHQVNLALLLRRPLLVRGPPGIGKSSLAYNIAWVLGLRRPLRWEIASTSTLQDGLYRYDAVGHLHAGGNDAPIEQHIRLGPLGTALVPTERPACLLVDELDKASYDLPNDLLHVFEEGAFTIDELRRRGTPDDPVEVATLDGRTAKVIGGTLRCHHHPVVVITTNDERQFPPAFLRRCVELRLPIPSPDRMAEIVHRWFPDEQDVQAIIEQFKGRPTDRLLQALFVHRRHHAPLDDVRPGLLGQDEAG